MKNLLFLALALLVISCSKDDGDAAATASLKVTVIDSKDTLVEGAIISIGSATTSLTTNSKGEVVFNHIPLGDYEITVSILNDPLDYLTPVSIKEYKEYQKTINVMAPPDPIEEGELDLEPYIISAYNGLKHRFIYDAEGYVSYWGAAGTDAVMANQYSALASLSSLDVYKFGEPTNILNSVWDAHYSVITDITGGLSGISKLERDLTPQENSQKAELLFIRALLYFNLTKIYGNPVVIYIENWNNIEAVHPQGRKLAYDLIIEDLLFAKENLAGFSTSTIASKEAAAALLGKVYLTTAGFPLKITENYNKALAQFEELEGRFSLAENYSSLFDLHADPQNEIIFKIDFDASIDQGSSYGWLWGPMGHSEMDGFLLSSTTVADYFDEGFEPTSPVLFPIEAPDKRFYQNIATFKVESRQSVNLEDMKDWRPYKYRKDISTPAERDREDFDFIVLRYADVLLMQAEAINAISGPNQKAYDLVNQVRERAYGDDKHGVQQGLDKEAFAKVLLAERKKEFFMEGHRKDDLVRMEALEDVIRVFNDLTEVNKKDYQTHEYIWPIPQSQMDLNPNIDQNPGYPE